jgi:hypothetical protein
MTWVVHLHALLGGSVWVFGYENTDNRLATGTPNADGRNTVFSLSGGTVLDDNLFFSCANSTNGQQLNQDLGNLTASTLNATNSALFPIRYKGATASVVEQATRFPFLWNSSNNRPQYVNASGVRTDVTNNYFLVYFVYTIQDRRNGQTVRITPAYAEYSTATLAKAVTWETVQGQDPDANDVEIRPLYKLTIECKHSTGTAYDVGCKYAVIREVEDIRKSKVSSVSNVGGSINEASVITVPRTNLTSTNLAGDLDIIEKTIVPIITSTQSSGTVALAPNQMVILSTLFDNTHTIVITPTAPTAFTNISDAEVYFSVGASLPSIAITAPSGTTFVPWVTLPTTWVINTKYKFMFIWHSTTRCDVEWRKV